MLESRRLGVVFLVLGAAGLVLSFWGLWRDVGWIAQGFYIWAWWSYILLLDGFTALRRGSSLFTSHQRKVGRIALWSVTFWFFFELLNLRYQNWYYVGVFAGRSMLEVIWGGFFTVAAFATVFTGLFQTYGALTALGLFARWKGRARTFPVGVSYGVQAVGFLMVGLSIVFPTYLAPLVWGSLTFIVDPWNYRHGARSLLKDLERGDYGLVARILVAGLACGLVWESFNFLAPQKWIYTVRGLEELKLFEMPLLGFLGFPALALDAIAAYAFLAYRLYGNETWEDPKDLSYSLQPRPAVTRRFSLALLPLHLTLWVAGSLLAQSVNVGSLEIEIEDLDRLPPGGIAMLREEGISRPRQLLRAAEHPGRRAELRARLELTGKELEDVLGQARLLTFKGIGAHHGELLRLAGIRTIEQLAEADPDALYEILQQHRGDARFPALRPGMVRVWTLAARARASAPAP